MGNQIVSPRVTSSAPTRAERMMSSQSLVPRLKRRIITRPTTPPTTASSQSSRPRSRLNRSRKPSTIAAPPSAPSARITRSTMPFANPARINPPTASPPTKASWSRGLPAPGNRRSNPTPSSAPTAAPRTARRLAERQDGNSDGDQEDGKHGSSFVSQTRWSAYAGRAAGAHQAVRTLCPRPTRSVLDASTGWADQSSTARSVARSNPASFPASSSCWGSSRP